ncbi:hypothetical protein [Actinokineospora cianjurensis]|uniref:hypothetical protein n=1 Tax=Actinokineospora cianjurensis TaxID=585224 RepID=UPI0011C3DB0D|nr:hypothetical protein [Actinokineospora cianjurensis]
MQPGEALHKAGDDGAKAFKRWLEATTRVKTVWMNTQGRTASRMTFKWPEDPESFSFDLGGIFRAGDIDNDTFLAECKAYNNHSNHQDSEFRSYLAKCYVTESLVPDFHDHYLWLTRHPFSVSLWSNLTTPEYISRGLLQESRRVFGCDPEDAKSQIDLDLVAKLSTKVWTPIVVSPQQENLIITSSDRAIVYGNAAGEGSL